ncbi:MAG: LamG domain-containing protein, partial [Bacteroidales bacterium]|nr:LamG domain-containing protein [Bacteroidales bacterium]
MKKIFVIIIAISAGFFYSCSKEDAVTGEPETQKGKVVFRATTEPATKTALEQDGSSYKVVWQNGDRITVVDGASNVGVYSTTSTTTRADFTFESGTEATTPNYKAFYPATMYNSGTPTLPATQNYAEGNISGSPMYSESSTESLAFKNICGIIRLNISTTMSGKKIRKIILGADQGMSGAITNAATLAADGYVATVSGTAGVTLDCGESGVSIGSTATPFHFSVPQNSYSSLSITVITTDGDFQVRIANKNITVNRSSMTNITLAFNNIQEVSGLVHHWPFNGDAKDVAGGLDATVYGATLTTDRFGNANSAYYFDGADQMAIGDAGNFGTSSFTANLWINSTQNRSSGANMIRTDGGTGGAGWFVRFANFGRIEIWTSGIGYTSPDTYNDGNWHMVTFVRDAENEEGKLYVDGVYIGGFTGLANVSNLYQTHYLGSYGGGETYEGKMDDVRFYNKALSEAEVLALYNSADPYTDLSKTEAANCYLVPAAGMYKFKATVKGNGAADLGGISKDTDPADINTASLVWATFNTTVAPADGELIKNICYSNGYVYFSTGDTYKEGNALVAIKNASDNILWSWHLWFESDNLVSLAQTYPTSGYVVMDRNLGALTNCYAADNALDFGFAYQHGRKDPFMMTASRTTYTQLGVLGTYTSSAGSSTVASS